MKNKTNSKEQKTIKNRLFDMRIAQNTRRLFNEFVENVNSGCVKNDGSDPLLSIIDKYVLDDKDHRFHKTVSKKTVLYRARVVDTEDMDSEHGFKTYDFSGYNENGSREAPIGKPGAGRNNISGVSYLYLAKDPRTACCEVKPRIRQFVSLAEFELQDTMHIIDFSQDVKFDGMENDISLGVLFTDIMGMYFMPVNEDRKYKATQFLTDYIRKSGVDGIAYRSYYNESGVNYTIFNSDHRRIRFIGSRLLLFQSQRQSFLDFEHKKVISSESVGGASYDSESAKKIASDIKWHINDLSLKRKKRDVKEKN